MEDKLPLSPLRSQNHFAWSRLCCYEGSPAGWDTMWKREVTGRRSKVPPAYTKASQVWKRISWTSWTSPPPAGCSWTGIPRQGCKEPSQPTESWDIFSFQASEFSRGLFYSNSDANSGQALSQFHVFQSALSSAFRPFSHWNTPACSSRFSSPRLCHGWEDTEQTHNLPEGIRISRTRFSCLWVKPQRIMP